MSNIRKRGVAYLHKALGREPSGAVAASKYFRAEESWTGKATWWFDLPIKKVKNNRFIKPVIQVAKQIDPDRTLKKLQRRR